MIKDYYELLQVHPKASADIIKKAYQTLAKKYHPDLSKLPPKEAGRHMSELNEAYRILSDPLARIEYDKARRQEMNQVRELHRKQQSAQQEKIPPRAARRHSVKEQAVEELQEFVTGKIKYVLVGLILLLAGALVWFLWGTGDDGEVHYKSLKGDPAVEERSRESSKPASFPPTAYDSHEEKLHPGNSNGNIPAAEEAPSGPVMIDGKQRVPEGTQEKNPEFRNELKERPGTKASGGEPVDVGEKV